MTRLFKGIVMHWTGGAGVPNPVDLDHYHGITDRDGCFHMGKYAPEANLDISDGKYARHTRGMNTAFIGLACAGMFGAREVPFSWGSHPINQVQLEAFCEDVAEHAFTYSIPVTRKTVLTHAEVQPTLGIWQRAKWDYKVLPGMSGPVDAIVIGDRMRAMVQEHMPRKTYVSAWRGWFK